MLSNLPFKSDQKSDQCVQIYLDAEIPLHTFMTYRNDYLSAPLIGLITKFNHIALVLILLKDMF